MKKCLSVLIALLLVCAFAFTAAAHSGRTDGNGGHYDSSTGKYHYHHGYPAHQHTNGCPYNYDDKTDHGNDWNSGSDHKVTGVSPDTDEGAERKGFNWGTVFIVLFLSFPFGACLGFLVGGGVFTGIYTLLERLLAIPKVAQARPIKRLGNIPEKVRRFCFLFGLGIFVTVPAIFFTVLITKWFVSP